MIRVFSHYIPARLMLLLLVEASVLILSVRFGLWFHLWSMDVANVATHDGPPLTAAVFGLGMMMVVKSMGLYEPRLANDAQSAATRLMAAVVLGLCVTLLVMHLVPSLYLGLDGLAVAAGTALVGSTVARWILARFANFMQFKPRVLVLGNGAGCRQIAAAARRHRNQVIVGYVDCGPPSATRVPLPRLLPAQGESLLSVVDTYSIDRIVIAVQDRRGGALPVQDLLECRLRGVRVSELSTFFEREHRLLLLESLSPSWMVFSEGFRQGLFRTLVKRLFDLVVSLTVLVLTLPIMAVTALLILLESGRPVFYRQERIGEGGRPFTILKFRSMRNGAESDGTPRWARANDDRTTVVGRIIRKTRIDELPQIFNVLKGEMSFVGPRPERPFFVEKLRSHIPYYDLRHSVKPGITGWAQVRYPYGASVEDAIEKLQYDLYYVKNHTLFLDLVILMDTVEVVLWGGGSGGKPAAQPGVPDGPTPFAPATLDPK